MHKSFDLFCKRAGLALLWLEALFWVTIVRVALTFLPFRRVLRLPLVLYRPAGGMLKAVVGNSIPDVVQAAASLVPGATCLTQALTAQLLFAQRGVVTSLRIGVAHGAHGKLDAHAWLEHGGSVVIGQLPDLERFSPLPSLERSCP